MLEMTSFRSAVSGLDSDNYFLLSFIGIGVIFTLIMLWLLRIIVTKRVRENTEQLQQANAKLHQDLAACKAVEKEFVVHKEHLIHVAHYDNLTALPNRIFFNEMLNKNINHANRYDKMLAILIISLDQFQNIMAAIGHPAVELLLKEIAGRFLSVLRAGDILARLSGDEFIVLLNDITDPKIAGSVAEKLLYTCSQPAKIQSQELIITASIGICIYPNDGIRLEDLQKNADMALEKAKRTGGNVFTYFTKEMDIEAHQHIKEKTSLRKAISNNEFVLYFQPLLNLQDGSVNSAEALIRWDHPVHGIITPERFIPHAEETGMILQIGEWVLGEACRINKLWLDQGYQPIRVAVNLSTKQFRNTDIVEQIANALNKSGLDPNYLTLEISENTVMNDVDDSIKKLHAMKKLGVHLTIDNFGTGYISINYLNQIPVNVLKIDRSFVKGIPNNSNDLALANAVISLAHSLGIKAAAEGVETAEQLQFLADATCDVVQGYYLSRPLPQERFILQLRTHATENFA